MSSSWNAFITILTLLTIAGSFWLLLANRTRSTDNEAKTGHVYDGIEEYDNPLPAWWLYMFVLTLVFALGYLVAYPGFGSFPGLLGWTQIDQWQKDVDRATARYEPVFAAYRNMSLEQMAADEQANRMGQRLFANNCAQCHGADARGNRGYPNLTDGDWIWGGNADTVLATITEGRQGAMPPWAAMLGDQGVENVANYVLALSGAQPHNDKSRAGEAQFQAICGSCHGMDGSGNPMLGAPRLNDDVWLYGGELQDIEYALRNGRNGKMPAFASQLDEDRIRLLAAYVLSLSQNAR